MFEVLRRGNSFRIRGRYRFAMLPVDAISETRLQHFLSTVSSF